MTTTKIALCRAMEYAAAHTNRCRAVAELAKIVPAEDFIKATRQHPGTAERDVEWAHETFERAKAEYEQHCASLGVPAYVTYDGD